MEPLAHPVRAALSGPHDSLAEVVGQALRYQPEVTPFAALPDDPGADDWADLARLLGPRGHAALLLGPVQDPADVPAGWSVLRTMSLVQMVHGEGGSTPVDGVEVLGERDRPEMAELVRRTEPGPFLDRTTETGRYLGVRREGRLVAMAGERMRLPDHVEVSAVCTDPAYRGQGLASRLLRAVMAGVRAGGATPFLHVVSENVAAIGLYETLGFRTSRTGAVLVLAAPDA